MPTNKNAMSRIAFLDEILSDKNRHYSLDDLTEKCNESLEKIDVAPVTRRCIEYDINYIEYGGAFDAEIERYTHNGRQCLRYKDPSFSIFKKKLSDDEKNLLQEALSTLGQFDGLENFEWLDGFKKSLEIEDRRKIISFSRNPYLKNSNLLGALFNYISNKIVITLIYRLFNAEENKATAIHPYLLKQYNDRWYIIGAAVDDGKILTFALDRIVEVKPLENVEFIEPDDGFYERFDDIIGVTNYAENPVLHIVFWMSDFSKDYVLTKPIHGSQKLISGGKEDVLRGEYPSLTGGKFFSIDCKCNYELIRELTSFGENLLVLSPKEIRDKIFNKICEMKSLYEKVRQ